MNYRLSPSAAVHLALALLAACSPPKTKPEARPTTPTRTATCNGCSLAVQVLGSGGPIPDDARASSGYLVWIDGKSRLLVDAGGGVFLRFAEAGASLDDLDAIALSHLHADHSADVIALLKGGYFASRTRPLPLAGPTGSDAFPSTDEFLSGLLAPPNGAFRYLGGYLEGKDGLFHVPVVLGHASSDTPERLFEGERFTITAVGVEHGHIPALSFLVETKGKRIAFGGDHGPGRDGFVTIAKNADIALMHHPVPDGVGAGLNALHRTPTQIGEAAARARVKTLVLSHHMSRALERRNESLTQIAKAYEGPVHLANDLDCYCVK